MRIRVGVEYKNPPNLVKDALYRATSTAKNVLAQPKTKVFLVDFADHAVIYEIKFYMGNHARINETNDAVRTNVWYELKRQGISHFPSRSGIARGRKAAPPVRTISRGIVDSCVANHSSSVFPTNNSIIWSSSARLNIFGAANR